MKLSSTQRMVQQLVSPDCSSKIFIILFLNFPAPGDFSAVTSLPVTFTNGSLVTTVSVTINEDSIHEANEVFTGNLRHVGVQRIQITEDEATVTITDNDGNYYSHLIWHLFIHTLFPSMPQLLRLALIQ